MMQEQTCTFVEWGHEDSSFASAAIAARILPFVSLRAGYGA